MCERKETSHERDLFTPLSWPCRYASLTWRPGWHTHTKLNDDKTEAVLIKSSRTTFPNAQPTSLRVGSADILFTTCARNLGFTISNNMSLDKHISNVCRSAYVEIRRIGSIRQYLTKTLACAFVLSKLDHCNSLLSNCPLYIFSRLQKVQNSKISETELSQFRALFLPPASQHITDTS